ncbi:hypothetical protein A3Q56_01311 [Intoshia linei]|uniref:Uncharacterized protein n=1 Tax=Intoshia linei TaxID=1819745 RepID=A0A177B9I7_9BILA|nr:hypothetical protein A3Q56_01311 [Intoshia linei]
MRKLDYSLRVEAEIPDDLTTYEFSEWLKKYNIEKEPCSHMEALKVFANSAQQKARDLFDVLIKKYENSCNYHEMWNNFLCHENNVNLLTFKKIMEFTSRVDLTIIDKKLIPLNSIDVTNYDEFMHSLSDRLYKQYKFHYLTCKDLIKYCVIIDLNKTNYFILITFENKILKTQIIPKSSKDFSKEYITVSGPIQLTISTKFVRFFSMAMLVSIITISSTKFAQIYQNTFNDVDFMYNVDFINSGSTKCKIYESSILVSSYLVSFSLLMLTLFTIMEIRYCLRMQYREQQPFFLMLIAVLIGSCCIIKKSLFCKLFIWDPVMIILAETFTVAAPKWSPGTCILDDNYIILEKIFILCEFCLIYLLPLVTCIVFLVYFTKLISNKEDSPLYTKRYDYKIDMDIKQHVQFDKVDLTKNYRYQNEHDSFMSNN